MQDFSVNLCGPGDLFLRDLKLKILFLIIIGLIKSLTAGVWKYVFWGTSQFYLSC